MQVSRFTNGGFVVHKLRLAGMASRFSIWVSAQGILQDAERIDRQGRAYPVKRDSMCWARLDGRAQILATQIEHNGPTPIPRCHAPAEYGGSPWAP
jgi:hypothetical protein